MKAQKNFTRKLSLATAGIFSASIMATPALTFAAGKSATTTFHSESECVSQIQESINLNGKVVKNPSKSELKQYGLRRVEIRQATLKKVSDKKDAKVPKHKKIKDVLEGESKFSKVVAGSSTPDPDMQPAQDSTSNINEQVVAASNLLKDAKRDLKKDGNSKAEIAKITCSVIFKTRVYSYLYYAVIYTYNLDNLANINKITGNEVRSVNKWMKKWNIKESRIGSLPKDVDNVTLAKQGAQIQALIDELQKLSSDQAQSGDFAHIISEYGKLNPVISKQYKAVHPVYRKAKAIAKKKAKAAQTNNGTGGTAAPAAGSPGGVTHGDGGKPAGSGGPAESGGNGSTD